jgi:hypothetical protein
MCVISMAITWKTIRLRVELPDDAAAQEFALKVMRGLVDNVDDDWTGWTMEVTEGGRPVWRLPFDAMKPREPLAS